MTREFREEAGVTLPKIGPATDAWTPFCLLSWESADAPGDDAGQVVFFRAVSSRAVRDAETMETEPICRIALRDVLRPGMTRRKCLPNLRWLIPLALDPDATVVHARIGGTLTPTGSAGQ
jgi:8-oxo-dGTP pyrophosphatase MutT (NUDIX family)